ncbi:putative MFS transporter [Paenibacillus agaridevorans]|uniref:Putative MFS transporter n=1 Tax=Paenibacillus agaridevorans TaxID=171404 RepID=A0A2R5EXQ0_9BACL|nr:putative MFS transporter [Paenibacillus agaridevorans]
MADILYTMALTVMVLNQTDSLISATLVPLIRGAMGMISGSVASLLMARIKLTRLLFVSQLGQFVVFSLLVLYLWNRGDSSYCLFCSSCPLCHSWTAGQRHPATRWYRG